MGDGAENQAVIELSALRSNYALARELAGGRDVIAVIKADAYGHGAEEVARCLEAEGCRRMAVVSPEEGLALREAGISGSILLLGGIASARQADLVARQRLTPVIHHARGLAWARRAARRSGHPWPVQIEVDTGMRRMGVAPERLGELAADIASDPALELEGIYTHFSSADDSDPGATLAQIVGFRAALAQLRARGVAPGLVHAANSSALHAAPAFSDALPEATAVRPGLLLYGARSADHEDPDKRLRPVMSVRTRVVAVRTALPGESVGYGATWRAPGPRRLATLSIGYADGVLRSLSNRGEVWLGGGRRPIVGRVSMDYVSVDVSGVAPLVEVGDVATFFGPPPGGGKGIRVEEQAEAAGTLSYELLVRVGNRFPRIPIDTI